MRRITSTSHDEQLAPVISGEKNELTTAKMVSVIVDPSLSSRFSRSERRLRPVVVCQVVKSIRWPPALLVPSASTLNARREHQLNAQSPHCTAQL